MFGIAERSLLVRALLESPVIAGGERALHGVLEMVVNVVRWRSRRIRHVVGGGLDREIKDYCDWL